MLDHIKKLFQSEPFNKGSSDSGTPSLSQEQMRLACAALLIEVAVIDDNFDESELGALQHILQHEFNVAKADISDMIHSAKKESADSTSMYQFTRLINDHCNAEDKFKLVSNMWRIAYADDNLDKYEEYIIRKVADLIHVNHSQFIRAKIVARDPPQPPPNS